MIARLKGLLDEDSIKRVIRTFVIAFAGVAIPGSLSWLNDLTAWASSEGQMPFPDAHSLAFLGVCSVIAGFVALLNLIVISLENATGKGVLRTVPPRPTPPEGGHTAVWYPVLIACLGVPLIVLLYWRT